MLSHGARESIWMELGSEKLMSIVYLAGWILEAFKAGAFGLVISVGPEEFPVSCADG